MEPMIRIISFPKMKLWTRGLESKYGTHDSHYFISDNEIMDSRVRVMQSFRVSGSGTV